MRALPTAGQSFPTIRNDNFLYVDKTEYIHKIIQTKGCLFLSRPRLFGKSLLLSAMAEVLKGERDLFKGLWIESSGYDFKKYPVVKLTMPGKLDTTQDLRKNIIDRLKRVAIFNGLNPIEDDSSPADTLINLVETLKNKSGEKVAVLIDECDAPILSHINNINGDFYRRNVLHDFYTALKTLADDDQLRLLFITGGINLTQVSIFSAFNNLTDLTFNPDFNGVCGFTMEEFDSYFTEYLPTVLEYRKSKDLIENTATIENLRDQIMDYFEGYSWDGESQILNPFSLLKFLYEKQFENFWYSSGTPPFLFENIQRNPLDYVKYEKCLISKRRLEKVNLEDLDLTPLLFHTGYLTLNSLVDDNIYSLRAPNKEVTEAFNIEILRYITAQKETVIANLTLKIKLALDTFDSVALGEAFSQILRWIPVKEEPALETLHYASIFAVLKALHFTVTADVDESKGIFDLWIRMQSDTLFVVAFKYEQFGSEPDLSNEDKRQELMDKALGRAKNQLLRRYDAWFRAMNPMAKKLAVGIVGKSDVVVVAEEY
jgi:hypothetical protein